MAISTTTLNGTDSIAASRITINDNFNTIKSALNDLLSIVDIATGKINNYGYGSNNDIETEDLIVRGSIGGGISVLSGGITVSSGPILISSSYLQLGSGTNIVKMEKASKTLNSGSVPVIDFSGTSGASGGTGPIGYMTIPRMTTADIDAIISPSLGSIVYDTSLNTFKGCTGSSSNSGASTWRVLS
jgi:hypothetical protein